MTNKRRTNATMCPHGCGPFAVESPEPMRETTAVCPYCGVTFTIRTGNQEQIVKVEGSNVDEVKRVSDSLIETVARPVASSMGTQRLGEERRDAAASEVHQEKPLFEGMVIFKQGRGWSRLVPALWLTNRCVEPLDDCEIQLNSLQKWSSEKGTFLTFKGHPFPQPLTLRCISEHGTSPDPEQSAIFELISPSTPKEFIIQGLRNGRHETEPRTSIRTYGTWRLELCLSIRMQSQRHSSLEEVFLSHAEGKAIEFTIDPRNHLNSMASPASYAGAGEPAAETHAENLDQLSNKAPKSQAEELSAVPQRADPRVFVSHSHQDKEFAEQFRDLLVLAFGLETDDIRCTSASGSRITPGADVNNTLKRETRHADTFVVLISEKSVESEYVLFEMGARWATDDNDTLFVVCLPGTDYENIPGPAQALQAVPADDDDRIQELLEALERKLKVPLRKRTSYSSALKRLTEFQLSPPASTIPDVEIEESPEAGRSDDTASGSALVDIHTAGRKGGVDGYEIGILASNYADRPVKLLRVIDVVVVLLLLVIRGVDLIAWGDVLVATALLLTANAGLFFFWRWLR